MGGVILHDRHNTGVAIATSPPRTRFSAEFRFRLVLVSAICFSLFGLLWLWVGYAGGRPLPFDLPLAMAIIKTHWGPLQPLVDLVSWLGGPRQTIAGVVIVVVVGLAWRRVALLMVAGALSGPIYSAFNAIAARPRPPSPPVPIGGFSFPSGHAVFFTTYSLLLIVIIARRAPRALTIVAAITLSVVWVVALLSRIWAVDHWPSDVLAGALLGGGWVALILSVRRLSRPVLPDDRVTARALFGDPRSVPASTGRNWLRGSDSN